MQRKKGKTKAQKEEEINDIRKAIQRYNTIQRYIRGLKDEKNKNRK